MNIWNKVFIAGVIVLAIVILVLGAAEMKIRGTGLKTTDALQEKIDRTEADIAQIKDGSSPKKKLTEKSGTELSFEELRSKLTVQLAQRGRSWNNCIVSESEESIKIRTLPPNKIEGADADSAKPMQQVEVQLVITEPLTGEGTNAVVAVPESLKGVVYAFKQDAKPAAGGADKAVFLGRFTVTSAPIPTKYHDVKGDEQNAYQVSLVTADPLNEDEIKTIEEADGAKWTLLLSPPKDVAESDPDKRRDAAVALNYALKERNELTNTTETLESSLQTYEEAETKSRTENGKMEQDIALEEKRAKAMQENSGNVNKTLKEYDASIQKLTLQQEKMQVLQSLYLAKIAEAQLKVKQKIQQEADAAAAGVK
ncbi:MAG: hypothetical protein LBT89_05310 [Planctomycetaceae bacterium]|jgi:hypothetical protein|nr:hypothetical protein [Planctomycetaceae bacterium]